MQHVIALQGVTKRYGSQRGITDISFDVPAGSVTGFLGPNGAGKTTTISMLTNLTRPTSGSIKLFGQDATVHGLQTRRRIGFLAGDTALDKGLTGWQQLTYFGNLRGNFDKAYVRQLADRLSSDLSRKIKTLSRGNRQKIGLIAALMHQPDLLILDEPTSGLDPLVQAQFNKIILEHAAAGKTTFISSHVLSEVQELCDRVLIVREGQLVANTTMDKLRSRAAKQVTISVSGTTPIPVITSLTGASHVQVRGKHAMFAYQGDVNDLLRQLSKHKLSNISIQEADLEHLFMQYYEGTTDV